MHDVLTRKDDKAADFASPALCVVQVVRAIEDIDTAQIHLPNLNTWLRQGDPIPALTAESVKHTFSTFHLLVADARYNAVFRDPAPLTSIEFIGIHYILMAPRPTLARLVRSDMTSANLVEALG
ncbi:hypothetical protein C8R44DRAFT_741755 [Mycena epipterygia]|nr:hypothetical protein C8R44DRAFT_741755 [Mycena epipterygia]